MRKYILLGILFLLASFFATRVVFASIPIGSLVSYVEPNVSNDNIIVTNKQGNNISSISGLLLYPGDTLDSNSEKLVLLIPSTEIIIKVSPYTVLDFNVVDMGKSRYVVQIIITSGEIELEGNSKQEIMQILRGLSPLQDVNRIDGYRDTSTKSMNIFTQVINDGGNVLSKNVNYNEKIVVSKPGFNVQIFVESFDTSKDVPESLMQSISPPAGQLKTKIQQYFGASVYFRNYVKSQYLAGLYQFNLERGKFFTSLQIPLFFPRNNFLYHPMGENDWAFGSSIPSDDILLVSNHIFINLLKKLNKISYGKTQDAFYIYYGKQEEWNNESTSLFAYRYTPTRAFNNNFNEDFILKFDWVKFGNDFRIRQFQPVKYNSTLIQNFDIVYNRVWLKPSLPFNQFELGLTIAMDFSIGKLNEKDTNIFVDEYSQYASYYLGFTGFDMTIPLINYKRYIAELNAEIGLYLPFAESGLLVPLKGFSNYIAKGGFTQYIYSGSGETKHGIKSNFYYATGFAKPHYALNGSEYTNKFYITRAIALLEYENKFVTLDNTTAQARVDAVNARLGGDANTGINPVNQSYFSQVSYIPEIEYFVEAKSLNLYIGTYYPIILENYETFLYSNPALYASAELNLDEIIPEILSINFKAQYTINNFEGFDEFGTFNTDEIFQSFALDRTYLNSELNFEFNNTVGLSAGIFTTPDYDDNANLVLGETSSPLFSVYPLMNFYVKVGDIID